VQQRSVCWAFCVKLSWKCRCACGQLKKSVSDSLLARINDNCLVQLTRQHYSSFSGLSLMTYHRELCLFPAIIQIAFGDVNSSRLINHASRDSLTLRMSNVLAGHLFFSRFPNLPTTYRLILYHPIFKMLLKPPVEMHWESLIFIIFFSKCNLLLHLGGKVEMFAWLTFEGDSPILSLSAVT